MENSDLYNHHPEYLRPASPSDFLPPISRWTTLGGIFLFGTVATLFGLVASTPYQIVVKASARIRPEGEIQIVQSPAVGKIRSIQVKNNQIVKQGDILAIIDDSQLAIQQNQLQNTIERDSQQLEQIKEQVTAVEQKIIAEQNKLDTAIAAAQVELARQQRQYQERQIITTAEVAEVEAELKLAREEYRRYQQLAKTGAIPLLQLKEKEATRETVIARLEKAQAALNPTTAYIEIARKKISQTKATGKATLASLMAEKGQLKQQQAEFTNNLSLNQKELGKIALQRENTILRSPVDGTIQQLYIRNQERVVTVGDKIADLVPQNRPLEIKAWVAATDINKIAAGQSALIKVSACPYPDYGTLPGNVITVAPDSVQNNNATNTGYEVTIKPQNLFLSSSAQQCFIQAGMEGTAEILTQKETVLTLLLRKARLIADI